MENKIEIGEYVRTVDGTIAKIEDNEFDLRYWCSDSIQAFYRYFKNKELITERIVKHFKNKNIIELIEVGDYANGGYVYEIGQSKNGQKWVHTLNGLLLFEQDIKSIVTKEQFDSIKYKVKEWSMAMSLGELLEEIEEKMNAKDLTDKYLLEHNCSTRKDLGIGEYAYGITMIPCEWVYPYLKELQNSIPRKKIENEIEILKTQCGGNPFHIQQTLNAEIRLLEELLEEK